jgi:hypothetical protein
MSKERQNAALFLVFAAALAAGLWIAFGIAGILFAVAVVALVLWLA